MKNLVERVAIAESAVSLCNAQVRLLVSQGFQLDKSMPLALALLSDNPLIETEYCPGDLMKAVLSVDASFWIANEALWSEAHSILNAMDRAIKEIYAARSNFEKLT